jgi:hypothetical protein
MVFEKNAKKEFFRKIVLPAKPDYRSYLTFNFFGQTEITRCHSNQIDRSMYFCEALVKVF